MKHNRRKPTKLNTRRPLLFNFVIIAVVFFFCFIGIGYAQSDASPDEENCLMCHRYPRMGRYDEDGTKRVYYINDQLFAKSVHGILRCKSCHVDVDKIPHENVKKVDCSTQCHLKDPSSNREFSHRGMVEKYQNSVHGKGTDHQKKFPEDRPTCTYCHSNRSYNPYAGFWGKSEALSRETLARCQGCHTDKAWTEKVYAHFTHRLRRRRSPDEIVKLCTSCHEDRQKMARHGIEAISTYKDTFHWILVKYGVHNAPDCITCHVPVGYTTHMIRPRDDAMSPINKNNRIKTCSNQGGIQTCHPNATIKFAEGRVHAYGTKVQLMAAADKTKVSGNKEESLLVVRAREEITRSELFHYRVLSLITLFYKIFIGLVIGFMIVHQLLEHRRLKRNARKEDTHDAQ